jgi:ArsR family transcriptional regulator, arsenate/arsenite/antimonite-responsive transcriptional repressor
MAFSLEKFFVALSDRTRLRLLNLMRGDEVCVCFLVEVLRCPQPTVSRHLAYLRRAGLVRARKEGRWMHYQVVEPPDAYAARILRETFSSLAGDKEMQRDRSRLLKLCCTESVPARLQEAPRPASLQAG